MTNEEKLIKFFNVKLKKSKNNEVSINKHELPEIDLTEQEVIQCVYLLKEDNLLDIVRKSVHDDLSMTCTVSLKSSCVHYFDNKTKERNTRIREWIWWGITTLISIGALVVAIMAL